jgi:hypothetical protein
MNMLVKRYRAGVMIFMMAGVSIAQFSCASIPKEVVELSYRMGEDMASVHLSYRALIRAHFGSLKTNRLRYLNDEYAPLFIRTWIADGRLRDIVKGEVVWSEQANDFVKPSPGHEESELLESVTMWSNAAIEQIESKKSELLTPLDSSEQQLQSLVDEAFNRLYRGNAAITAHLNSLREVQAVQDSFLSALNIRDLRDKINNLLAQVSHDAEKGLEIVRKADAEIQKAK